MKRESIPPVRAVRGAVVAAVFAFSPGFVPVSHAQEEAPAEEAAPPAEGQAPAGATAIDPNTLDVVPVETAEPAEAPPAQGEKEGTELDTIEVTGSRIKRSDYETEAPILVIKREDIERTGLVSIGDILQNLPQAGAALSRAFNNGGNGATEIDLRNLGSNRVLVLVNGRRWVGGVSQFNTSAVDLNTIPISAIDSIEVLKDGASAVYGSDAIAGVINIKTRRDYVGAEVRGHYEATQKGDGVTQHYNFAGGTVAGKTSVFFDVSYVNQGELLSGSRPESAIPKLGVNDPSRGSTFSPFGRFIVVPTNTNKDAINSAAGAAPTVTAPCYDITTEVAEGVPQGDPNVPPLPDFPNSPIGIGATICDLTLDRTTFMPGYDIIAPNPPDEPGGPGPGVHDFIRYNVNDHAYNYAPINYLITPSERTSIYGQMSHQLFDQLRFSSEVLYNVRKSTQQLAHTPIGLGDAFGSRRRPFNIGYVALDNPYNPTNPQSPYYIEGTEAQDIGYQAVSVIGLGAVLRRFNELGPRVFTQNVDTMRIATGLDGSFGGDGLDTGVAALDRAFSPLLNRLYSWDAGYIFGESKLTEIDKGLIDMRRVAYASGPVADCVGGQVDQPSDHSSGCVPLDWFGGPGAVTPDMAKYIAYTALDTSKQRQRVGYVNLSTEVGELGRWLAGPLGIAFGGELREEYYNGQPDPLKVNETSSTNFEKPTVGAYTAKEGYLELRVPALADITFDKVPGLSNIAWLNGRSLVEELEFSVATRYSNYTGFGDNLSGKFGVRYKPYSDLILRSTLSDAFRAPAITDLFVGQAVSFPTVVDPCADRDDAARDNEAGIENVRANCDADGASSSQSTTQIPTTFGGNPDLVPEIADTLSLGFVYSPSYLPDFNMYFDWYRIELEDFIGVVPPALSLDLCYRSDPGARSFCQFIERADTGQLAGVTAIFQNFAALQVEGVDFNIDWILPFEFLAPYGTFQVNMDAAYVAKYDQIVPTSSGEQAIGLVGIEFGGFGGIPRWKINGGMNWHLGDWEAVWNMRYIHHLIEPCDDGLQDPGATGAILSNPTKVNSLQEYGLCSQSNNPLFGTANDVDAVLYHDLQGGYSLPAWNTKLTFGVINALGQDPPAVRSAFADSYDKALHDPWNSRTPYLRFQVNF